LGRWRRTEPKAAARVALIVLLGTAGAVAARAAAPTARTEQPTPIASQELTFALHGERVARHALPALESFASAKTVATLEPYEGREVHFRALPFDALLDRVFGKAWRDEEEILFTCSDGYEPTVPVERFLGHRAWLAFDREDEEGFAISKLESGQQRRVALAPFYLIWENLEDAEIRSDGDYGWPYQLVGVDVIRARDRFPAMAPPEAASPRAVAGFRAFRIHCSRCHQINGVGGTIGPELNAPVGNVKYRDTAWLHRWIDDPSQIVEAARMPRLNPALPDREATIQNIIGYLEAMSRSGSHEPARTNPGAEPELDR
jgi:mono/diheme cytochrome c family protein